MLFVFDLDFTLWDCGGTWCDHTLPPYHKIDDNVRDTEGRNIALYPDVRFILETLRNQNVEMALASRTSAPEWAQRLLKLFDIDQFFKYQEIYPGSKQFHFESIQQKSGKDYSEMYFFDDEARNIEQVQKLGVNCIFIESGLRKSHLIKILSRPTRKKQIVS